MKILHILNEDNIRLADEIIEGQSMSADVKVARLKDYRDDYSSLVNEIFASDKVVSWQ